MVRTPNFKQFLEQDRVLLESKTHVLSLRLTVLFNNMRTLKFEGRPTNAFFAAVNQMFAGSSQLTTTVKHCFFVRTMHNELITARSAVVGSWEEPRTFD